MSAIDPVGGVVLRNALLHPEAVRIGRRVPAAPPAEPVAAVAPAPAAPQRDLLLEQALVEARVEGLRQGREEGLRAGYEDGLKKGEAEAQAAQRAAVAKAVEEASAPLQERERQLVALAGALSGQQAHTQDLAEQEAVVLAYEVACRILGAHLVTPEGVQAQAQQLLAAARQREAVFHVHPEDARRLQEAAADSGLRCVADPAVQSGGCLLQGPNGTLDARLETVLAQVRQGLLEARAQGRTQA